MIRKFRKIFRPTPTTLSPTKTDYVQAPFNRDATLLDEPTHVKPVPSSLNKQFFTGRAQHSFLFDRQRFSAFVLDRLDSSKLFIKVHSFVLRGFLCSLLSLCVCRLLTRRTWCAASRYLFILRNETHLKAACVCDRARRDSLIQGSIKV